ncbi:MAG: hypothetical protein H8E44_25595 [Planctomycetes bacterium]|nr:hypothetical protein [Planctomycetota bacterium]MBL7038339.1 hypothetical protein [Pirellulaceae bacterium]
MSARVRCGNSFFWYDPRKGDSLLIDTFQRNSRRQFIPRTRGNGQDWALVFDDESRRFIREPKGN